MSQKILLIEVDEKERQNSAQMLRDHQFTVSTAKDGPTGLKVFKHNHPDLIISNLVLGDMTAVDVCEKIRSAPGGEKIGIILVSNGSRSAKYIDGITDKYNVFRFLQKPFTSEELLKVTREALGKNGSSKVRHDKGEDSLSEAVDEKIAEAFAAASKPSKFFPGLILHYAQTQATGSLCVRKGKDEKILYIEKGNLVGIDSRIKSEQLGPVLVEKGVISEQDYMKSARLMVEEGTQLGEAIVKLGFLEQAILEELLVEHQIIKIANCFLWLDAELKFKSLSKLPEIKNYHVVPMQEVFKLGLQHLRKVTNLHEILKPVEQEYAVTNELYSAYQNLLVFSPEELKPLELLQNGYQVGEVCSAKTEFVIATLYLSGMLITTTPTVAMLLKRVEALKNAGSAQKNAEDLEAKARENEKQLAALQSEKAKIEQTLRQKTQEAEKQKNELAKAQAELDRTKQESQKSKVDPKTSAQIAQLQKELTATQEKTAKMERELSLTQGEKEALEKECADLQHQLSEQMDQETKASLSTSSDDMMEELEPLAPVAPAAGFESTEAMSDLFGSTDSLGEIEHGSPADSMFTLSPASQDSVSPSATDDLFSLGSELSELEQDPAPNPDSTVVFDPHADPAKKPPPVLDIPSPFAATPAQSTSPFATPPQSPPTEDLGIFDLAGDLSGLEETAPPNPDVTMVFDPHAAKPAEKTDTLFQANELEGELDQAFEQNVEGNNEPVPAAAPPQSSLELDPFAPENVRQQEVADQDLDDFFNLPK